MTNTARHLRRDEFYVAEGVPAHRFLSHPADVERAAGALAAGAAVAYGFANFYAIAGRPEVATVRAINAWKGRPLDQVGSVTTTAALMPQLFDWTALPIKMSARTVCALMEALFELGPFGFRGPAAAQVPAHLTSLDAGVRTTQLIAPGAHCPSNRFLTHALARAEQSFLFVTSANRSRHLTGSDDEAAHYCGDGIEDELGSDLVLLRHPDEAAARRRYPHHAATSTTVLSFHRLAVERDGADRRPALTIERHGSLPVEAVEQVVERFGLRVVLGPRAWQRLPQRRYEGRAGAA